MGRHHVRLVGARRAPIIDARNALQRPSEFEKARGRIGVVAGLGDDADADLVGLEFLLAREMGDRQLHARLLLLALLRLVEHLGGDALEQRRASARVRRAGRRDGR